MTALLPAAALLLGGWRDPRVFAAGGAAVWALAWLEAPAIGPAAVWLPWLAWAVLSAALSAQPLAGLPFLARWSAALVLFSLAGAWKERERETWLKAAAASSVVLAVAALATGAGHGFRATMTGLIPPYYSYTAFALAAGVSAAAAWLLHPRGPRGAWRAAAAAAVVLGLAAALLARSRGAWLGLAVAAVVWSVRRRGAKAAAAALILASLAAGAYKADVLSGPVRSVLVKRGRYQEARPEIWERAAAIADEAPVLGAGPGNFGPAFRRRPVEVQGGAARWGMSTPFAHSEPLQAAAETGWAGLCLWLIALAASLSVLIRGAGDEPAREAAALAAAAMLPQLALDNMLQIPGLAFLFFSALAVAGEPSLLRFRWPRPALLAGALLALVAWIPRSVAARGPGRGAALFPAEADFREDLAYRAMEAGRLDEADAAWKEAERLAPFDAVYPWRRAEIASAQGRWDAAESLAARAVELEPGFLNARVLRAEALAQLGRKADSREELTRVTSLQLTRGERLDSSGYDKTIWSFDRGEFDRAAAAAGRKR